VGFVPTYKHFSGFGFFLLSKRIHARPPAANANRWAAYSKQQGMFEMSDNTAIEVLLKAFEESHTLARQAEDQRATMSNFLITIAAVLFAFITQQGFTRAVIPLSLFIVFLGLFGLFMSAKYTQHYHRHYARIRLLRKRISELCPEAQIQEIEKESSDENLRRHPLLKQRMPIVYVWLTLHATICLIGVLSTILAVL
jgi:hypothetical protein